MTKLAETVLAGSIGVATALGGVGHAQTTQPTVKNIILVHGAFADGTSWAKVIPILEARGFHVVAVQNPLTSNRIAGRSGDPRRSLLGRRRHHRGRR
jgi:pimeloyl-ACP methyl ester carboxylesterase